MNEEELLKKLWDDQWKSIDKLVSRNGNVMINRIKQQVYVYDSVEAAKIACSMFKWSEYFRRCFDEMNRSDLITKDRYFKK